MTSSPGHVWQAIRENELRVEVLGLRPYAYKLMSFVLASFLATAGVSSTSCSLGGATPEVTSANFTLTLLVMVVIGGTGTRWGALLGGVLYTCGEPAARRRIVVARGLVAALVLRTPSSSRSSCSACSSSSSSSSFPAGSSRIGQVRGRGLAAPAGGDADEIAWEERGKGEPLLLIQGLGYGRWGWEPVVPALAQRYRVLSFDNRWHRRVRQARRARTRRS